MMDWKRELDALIESTTVITKGVKRQSIPDLPSALKAVEQALADIPKPVDQAAARAVVLFRSERDEIGQRVSTFRAHQQKVAQDREDYYLQVRARMMVRVDPNLT